MRKLPKKLLTAFVVTTLAGACLHFLYVLLPNPVTALLAPVNESLWEHLKIFFWPYLAAALLPKPYAMAAGAAGGVIADLLTAPLWAPATLLIKPLLVLPFSNGGERIVTRRNTAALVLAFFLSASGYFLAEGLMFGFHTAFLVSVSGSAVQSGGSALAFLAAGGALDRLQVKRRWRAGSRG